MTDNDAADDGEDSPLWFQRRGAYRRPLLGYDEDGDPIWGPRERLDRITEEDIPEEEIPDDGVI